MTGDKAIVLLSGGLDSATTLAVAQKECQRVYALSFLYGQRHGGSEYAAACAIAKDRGVLHLSVQLACEMFRGSALTDDVPIPTNRDLESRYIPETYVPARNLVFLSIATAYAESLGANAIYIGVNAVDYSGYPDCRPAFIDTFQSAIDVGTRDGVEGGGIEIRAPLINLSKAEIIRLGCELEVDYAQTVSCYQMQVACDQMQIVMLACGACDSCRIRRQGFQEAGVPDPTRYAA